MTQSVAYPVALQGCVEALDRCIAVLDSLNESPAAHDADVTYTIGSHLRHCLDHFTCFLRGISEGAIDYDARDRDAELENSPDLLREAFQQTKSTLRDVTAGKVGEELRIRQTAAPDTAPSEVESNVERELIFLSSHAIHHLALIVQVCNQHGIEVDPDLGVAYSTASFRNASNI